MNTHTINVSEREAMLAIAEAIAPTWERRRGDIEDVATPVREWMLRLFGMRVRRCWCSPRVWGKRGSRRPRSFARPAG